MNKWNFKDYFNYFYLVCVLRGQHVRVFCVLPPMWVSEIEFRFSGLAANNRSHLAGPNCFKLSLPRLS